MSRGFESIVDCRISSSSLLKQSNNHRMCPINVDRRQTIGVEEDFEFLMQIYAKSAEWIDN